MFKKKTRAHRPAPLFCCLTWTNTILPDPEIASISWLLCWGSSVETDLKQLVSLGGQAGNLTQGQSADFSHLTRASASPTVEWGGTLCACQDATSPHIWFSKTWGHLNQVIHPWIQGQHFPSFLFSLFYHLKWCLPLIKNSVSKYFEWIYVCLIGQLLWLFVKNKRFGDGCEEILYLSI